MILPISQDGNYIFPSPRCKTCETSLSLLSYSMTNEWANLARTTFKIPLKCNFFLPPMQPSRAQPQTSLVWIIIPTGLSVPASAPYSLISTKYLEWSYQNTSHFTSLLQSTGCSPIPPNWNQKLLQSPAGPILIGLFTSLVPFPVSSLSLTPLQAPWPPCYPPTHQARSHLASACSLCPDWFTSMWVYGSLSYFKRLLKDHLPT